MNTVNISFEVPPHIQKGLLDGSMQLFGGTVRNLAGRIVAHLSPGKLLIDKVTSGAPFDAPALAEAIGSAHSAAMVSIGIGVINLAVTTAGFAAMRQKLNSIIDQLDQAQTAINDLKTDTHWIKGSMRSGLQSSIDSACDLASRATRLGDRDLFKEARTSTHKMRRHMTHMLNDILKEGHVISRRREFSELAKAYVLLASLEAKCDEQIEGSGQAEAHLNETTQEIAEIVNEFERQFRNYSIDTVARIRLGPDGTKELTAINSDLRSSAKTLNALADEITFRRLLGLDANGWHAMTTSKDSAWVTCVLAPDPGELKSMTSP